MNLAQPGILADIPAQSRYLFFSLIPSTDPRATLAKAQAFVDGDAIVFGIGDDVARLVLRPINGLRTFPSLTGPGIAIPSTPSSIWCWLRGNDRGELLHRGNEIAQLLSPAFQLEKVVDGFRYRDSRDLTGYIDGTENPRGEQAKEIAFLSHRGYGLDGSSFVAVQQWLHDFDRFNHMSQQERDETIGRRISDNKELTDAPPSTHVKRTAQESFDPAAFVLRRSMPWANEQQAGLMFASFGNQFDAFEALLNRMIGGEDEITDALFKFTKPVSGSYFWCPPMRNGTLDLSALLK